MPVDISDDRMTAFFSKFGKMEEVKRIIEKSGITTSDVELQVTLPRRRFGEILRPHQKKFLYAEKGGCWS